MSANLYSALRFLSKLKSIEIMIHLCTVRAGGRRKRFIRPVGLCDDFISAEEHRRNLKRYTSEDFYMKR
jgi:hypothetical protein